MVYGENPRDGFFREALFLHPDLEFQFQFPAGWTAVNQTHAAIAQSPNQDAMVQLSLSDATDAVTAVNAFVGREGVNGGRATTSLVNGMQTASADFTAQSEQTALHGRVSAVEYDGRVYQMLAFSVQAQWAGYESVVTGSLSSFQRLTDRSALDVQPMRLDIVRLDRSMTLRQFNERYPSVVSIDTVATINQAEQYTAFHEGDLVKRVVGGERP
jgi:predicted Zn-dependent protease